MMRFRLCSTSKMDLKDTDITEAENMQSTAHTDTLQTGINKEMMSAGIYTSMHIWAVKIVNRN